MDHNNCTIYYYDYNGTWHEDNCTANLSDPFEWKFNIANSDAWHNESIVEARWIHAYWQEWHDKNDHVKADVVDSVLNATNNTDVRKDNSKWNPHEGAFLQYMAQYDKHYDSFEDFQTHLKVFSEVTNDIVKHNIMNSDFKLGLNEFADWTDD